MIWRSYKRKHGIFGMRTGKRFREELFSTRNQFKRYRIKSRYVEFKLRIEDELRWDWCTGKFYANKSLREFNMLRKKRGWNLVSTVKWLRGYCHV